jgi:hypothetical protein
MHYLRDSRNTPCNPSFQWPGTGPEATSIGAVVMGQHGPQMVIRGKRTVQKRVEFRINETMPELWIPLVCMGISVKGCGIGCNKPLRKYERT